jgi:GH25 family lysozyme M1 (1,4-beta-N-acetylmuramidase)
MLKGIDVSSYQPTSYSTRGLAFVGIKLTEGLTYVNPHWIGQRATARSAGLVTIFYHYPHIANSATAEADHFLSQINLAAGDVLCLDWEWYGQKVTNDQARAYKTAWLAHVKAKAPGHRVILYCDRSVWTGVDTDSNAGDGLWIADYTTAGQPGIKAQWAFHQYTDAAPQGGDGDVANPTLFPDAAALHAWAVGTPTPPPPLSYAEDDMLAYLSIPAGTDVDIPVEPAGTAATPQGGAKNGPMWLGLAPQGTNSTVTVTLHTAKGWGKPTTSALTHGAGKHMVALPTDGSVDTVRVHSAGAPLIGYIVGRQVA